MEGSFDLAPWYKDRRNIMTDKLLMPKLAKHKRGQRSLRISRAQKRRTITKPKTASIQYVIGSIQDALYSPKHMRHASMDSQLYPIRKSQDMCTQTQADFGRSTDLRALTSNEGIPFLQSISIKPTATMGIQTNEFQIEQSGKRFISLPTDSVPPPLVQIEKKQEPEPKQKTMTHKPKQARPPSAKASAQISDTITRSAPFFKAKSPDLKKFARFERLHVRPLLFSRSVTQRRTRGARNRSMSTEPTNICCRFFK